MTSYTIRAAVIADAGALPEIEQSAGEAFRQIPEIAWVADTCNLSADRHRELIALGACWVAVDESDRPVGFLSGEVIAGELHIWELDVHHDRQKSGLGSGLVRAAIAGAKVRGLKAVTLTTFRNLRWNQVFYEGFGFEIVEAEAMTAHLAAAFRAEIDGGLPIEKRCAMRLALR